MEEGMQWQTLDWTRPLAQDCVEVILVRADDWLARIEWLRSLLSDDERARADAFAFQHKRVQSTLSRALLRLVLGRYLDVAPAEIKFSYSATGKPALDAPVFTTPLQFNVSHSGNHLLMAVTVGRAVGIDIEHVREVDDAPALARTVIADEDMPNFLRLNAVQQKQTLFGAWTQAEALAKASGIGIFSLTAPLAAFASRQFWVRSLQLSGAYQAALAAEGDDWHINCWRLPPTRPSEKVCFDHRR